MRSLPWRAACGAVAVLIGAAAGASAQVIALDSLTVVKLEPATCHRSARYTVVEVPLRDELGSDHFVGPATRSCAADSLAGDFVIRNEWAEYFWGLRGHYLLLDSGTGPDYRGLLVFDLRTRVRTFSGSSADLEWSAHPDTLGVWAPFDLPQPRPGCPVVEGLGAGVDSLMWVDLRTGSKRFGGRVRCATRQ